MTTIDPTTLQKGDIVHYVPDRFDWNPGGLRADVDYTVQGIYPRNSGGVHLTVINNSNDSVHNGLGFEWFDLGPTTPTPAEEPDTVERPLIDFSGDSRATARQYAYDLQSRVNKTETDQVLSQVAEGQQVDAYALAEALLDAQRGCLTRFGQSLSRRRAGEKVAHLGYIAHAVLANHADGLPAYAEGERSRVAHEARQSAADWERIATAHQEHIATLTEEAERRDDLLTEAAEALAEARSEVEKGTEFRQHANDEVTRLLLKLEEANRRAEQAERERDAAAATISYVVEALDPEWQQRVIGYWDGVKDATFPSTEG